MKNPFDKGNEIQTVQIDLSTPDGWQTGKKERMCYYLYFAGQNAVYFLIATYLTTYMMFQGVDLKKSAAVMLAVKIWDAVNDAVKSLLRVSRFRLRLSRLRQFYCLLFRRAQVRA